jgi:hypothetical protein
MPYTVAYSDAGLERHQMDAYVRLLEQRGLDWTNAPRVEQPGVPAPGASHRWLYVFDDRHEAEDFCAALRSETHDDRWIVRPLSPAERPSTGPLTPVVIFRRLNSLGAEFTLHPFSRTLVKRRFPGAFPATTVSLELSTLPDVEQQPGARWEHLALVLTGLTAAELAQLGGYRIVDPATDETVVDQSLVNLV